MTVLQVTFKTSPSEMRAADVPLMGVYTWGDRINYYLRTQQGCVCIATKSAGSVGAVLRSDTHTAHFKQLVEVVDAQIHITD